MTTYAVATPPQEPREEPPVAPGRYCLAVCYCGKCPHYVPLRRPQHIPPTRPPYQTQAAQ